MSWLPVAPGAWQLRDVDGALLASALRVTWGRWYLSVRCVEDVMEVEGGIDDVAMVAGVYVTAGGRRANA